ncbi:hypothetical protein PROFUN_13944 [Planoprotostelium fungivorum]|uniref:GRAM domain-containing protein n=1 Tax=Planoprotostelium fungivorum TaxID=1890364 RepID=A0A2P6N2J3_9EUKA|nr:hypothetical protein PROFUN_13944 [Planoprotostelium fungivorum]
MQFGGRYVPAQENWTTIAPGYQQFFERTTKHITTNGGTEVVDFQQPTGTGLKGKIHSLSHKVGYNSSQRWSYFNVNEPMIAEYPAKTSYGLNSKLGGWIYVSQNHFGWISQSSNNRVVTTLIPFSNIVDVVPSSRVKAARKQYTFQPLAANQTRAKAQGFQVFTKDNLVYQFFGLKKAEEFFNNLFTYMGRNPLGTTAAGYSSGFEQPFAQAAPAPGLATADRGLMMNDGLYQQQPVYVQQPTMMTSMNNNLYSTGGVRYAHSAPLNNNVAFVNNGTMNQGGLMMQEKVLDNRAEMSGLAPGQKMHL